MKSAIIGQFEAALAMHRECLVKCPEAHWDSLVGKYAFWMVSYHTLCFVDCYLSPSNDAFEFRADLHPAGRAELEEEYPSRRFSRDELIGYVDLCRQRVREMVGRETAESLRGPSGFGHLPLNRMELHLYNIRHVQHHTGQMGVFLRKLDVATGWVKTGWR